MDDERVVAVDADGNLIAVSLNELQAEWVRRCIDRVKSGCVKDRDFELLIANLERSDVQAFLQESWRDTAREPKRWDEFGRRIGAIFRGKQGRHNSDISEMKILYPRYLDYRDQDLNQLQACERVVREFSLPFGAEALVVRVRNYRDFVRQVTSEGTSASSADQE